MRQGRRIGRCRGVSSCTAARNRLVALPRQRSLRSVAEGWGYAARGRRRHLGRKAQKTTNRPLASSSLDRDTAGRARVARPQSPDHSEDQSRLRLRPAPLLRVHGIAAAATPVPSRKGASCSGCRGCLQAFMPLHVDTNCSGRAASTHGRRGCLGDAHSVHSHRQHAQGRFRS